MLVVTRVALLGLCGAIAVIIATRASSGDAVRDVGVRLDLVEKGPFRLRLGGPLWRDRTLRDREGAADVAYVARDEPLAVEVTGRDGRRPVSVEVQVDGTRVAAERLCRSSPCPTVARTIVTPALRGRAPGTHRVAVIARGAGRTRSVTTRFEVTTARAVPRAREAEPVAARAAPAPGSAVPQAQLRRTLAILGREQRSGVLRGLVGTATYRVVALGRLESAGRPIGTTALLSLSRARARVHARLPAYSPAAAGSGYLPQIVTYSGSALRDLLVDVDLTRRRIIGVEPGPASATDQWRSRPPQATADTAVVAPRMVRLSEHGPAFLSYDGDPDFNRRGRDWPVSLVFAGRASVGKVKRSLRKLGFTRRGHARYLGYRTASGSPRFDGDRGLKTACDADGTDVHLRLYAPTATDRFRDPQFGDVVVATVHLDRADGCRTPPKLFGFSEWAEQRIASMVAEQLGWKVRPGFLALGNAEPYRRDITDRSHVWWSDGRATLIEVP